MNLVRTWKAIHTNRLQGAQYAGSSQYAPQSADDRQQDAFDNELPRHLWARGADCKTRGQLLDAEIRSRERQVRDVYTADQQQESRSTPEQIECGLDAANQNILEPLHTRVKAG